MPEARLERTRKAYERKPGRLPGLVPVPGSHHWLGETPEWVIREFQRAVAPGMRSIDAVSKPMK